MGKILARILLASYSVSSKIYVGFDLILRTTDELTALAPERRWLVEQVERWTNEHWGSRWGDLMPIVSQV
jgi:hypothetical protein